MSGGGGEGRAKLSYVCWFFPIKEFLGDNLLDLHVSFPYNVFVVSADGDQLVS